METENKDTFPLRTSLQEEYVVKVMKSRRILDGEYKELKTIWDSQVLTSKDAGIFLAYLFALQNFRRTFINGRHKAYKFCHFCGLRDGIIRIEDFYYSKRLWSCENCFLNSDGERYITFPLKVKNEI